MANGANEKDWKLFRSRLPDWQENYMEKIIEEYRDLLCGEEQASDKFWALDERIKQDKRNPGVLIRGIRRSDMEFHLLQLLRYGVIRLEDLQGFSKELQEKLTWIMGNE